MSLELNDWIDYCEEKKDFDKSHFYTLFLQEDNSKGFSSYEYQKIFKYFSEKDELINRLTQYFSHENYKSQIDDLKTFLILSTRKDIEEKKQALDDDELLNILSRNIYFVEDFNEFCDYQLDEWNGEYISLLGDSFRRTRSNEEYALFEAYYGLTSNIQLVWYLGSPLLDTKINFDHYFDIWKVGGDYAVTENGIYVSTINQITM